MEEKRYMKGAILPGNSTVELKDFEIPKPGHGQVLIKTMASTICGSDIRCIYREHTGKGAEGYIPGAVFFNVGNWQKLLPKDKNALIVFYCANRLCSSSQIAAYETMKLGYTNVWQMPDGIYGWKLSGRHVELP